MSDGLYFETVLLCGEYEDNKGSGIAGEGFRSEVGQRSDPDIELDVLEVEKGCRRCQFLLGSILLNERGRRMRSRPGL